MATAPSSYEILINSTPTKPRPSSNPPAIDTIRANLIGGLYLNARHPFNWTFPFAKILHELQEPDRGHPGRSTFGTRGIEVRDWKREKTGRDQ